MQPISKHCFKIKRGHWKTCRAKNTPYLGRTSPYPPFHWVPPGAVGKGNFICWWGQRSHTEVKGNLRSSCQIDWKFKIGLTWKVDVQLEPSLVYGYNMGITTIKRPIGFMYKTAFMTQPTRACGRYGQLLTHFYRQKQNQNVTCIHTQHRNSDYIVSSS